MGGGNGQKSRMARERNLEKAKAPKGSQLESNKKAMSIQRVAFALSAKRLLFVKFRPLDGTKVNTLAFIGILDYYFRIQRFNVCIACKCKVCMQPFMCTTLEVKCREHAEAKHPKSDLYACFPHLKK
ncbi:hypothetical protein DITRI_Ditri18aG0083200 [Diplodiscus trichospermus]